MLEKIQFRLLPAFVSWFLTFIFFGVVHPMRSQCPPGPANLSYMPSKAQFCPNEQVTITFNTPDIIVNLDWNYMAPPHVSQSGPNNVFLIPGVQPPGGQLMISGELDVNGMPCHFSFTDNISLSPDVFGDAGQDVFLYGNVLSGVIGGTPSATGGIAPYSYAWSPATNISSSGASNPFVYPTTTTVYQLIVTDANGCDSPAESVVVHYVDGLRNKNYYAVLSTELDAGFYQSLNLGTTNKVYFKFDEEYYVAAGNTFAYSIYDNSGALVSGLSSLPEIIGDNRYALDVSLLAVGQFYRLEAKNLKGEIWQARIKIN